MKQMDFAFTWILVGASCMIGTPKRIPSFAGPYRALITRVSNASEDFSNSTGKFWLQLQGNHARGKQLQYGWGYSRAYEPLSNDMKIRITLASRSNNQWKKNAFIANFDLACASIIRHSVTLVRLVYGPKVELNCPLKPVGLRKIENQTFEIEFPHFPVLPYGRYLVTFVVVNGDEIAGLGVSDVNLVPKL